MLKKFGNIFKRKNVTNSDSEDSDSVDMEAIMEDINRMALDMNCDHGWIDYNEELLIEKDEDNQRKIANNLEKLLIKRIDGTLDPLGKRMLDLMIGWIPPCPKIYGTCMTCGRHVLVMYLGRGQIATMY